MRDTPPSFEREFASLIGRLWKPIVGFIGGVTVIYQFIRVLQGDTSTITWISTGLGLIVSFAALAHLGFSTRASPLEGLDGEGRRVAAYPRIYRPARVGLAVLALASTIIGLMLWQQGKEPLDKLVFLVADFSGPDPEKYRVTDVLLSQLRQSLSQYGDTVVRALGEVITEQQGHEQARSIGDQHNADFVLWGWYGVTGSDVLITVHIENLTEPKPRYLPLALGAQTLPIGTTYVARSELVEIESFSVQQRLSEEMEALALFVSGVALYRADSFSEAVLRLNAASETERWPSGLVGKEWVHFYLALAHTMLGEEEEAIEEYSELTKFEPQILLASTKDADPSASGVIRMNIGLAYQELGDLEEGERFYQEALFDFEQADDALSQAQVSANLANLEWVRGRRELAKEYLQNSEAYLKDSDPDSDVSNPSVIAQIRSVNAYIYDALGESQTAETLYQEALDIYSKHPDPVREASTLINYAGLKIRLNQLEEAKGDLVRAQEMLDAYSGPVPQRTLGVLLNNLARVHQDSGDFATALAFYEEARDTFDELNDPLHYAGARENEGVILAFQRDFQGSEQAINEALDIYREFANRDHEAKALFNLYSLYGATNQSFGPELLDDLLTIVTEYQIDKQTESGILFGILVEDLASEQQLITYRERLKQLKLYYEEREEPASLGRSLLKLAEVEQSLHNLSRMEEYALEAEVYADRIPLPLRISFHTDLGFYLLDVDPDRAIEHLFEAFDLAGGVDPIEQQSIALVTATYVSVFADVIDKDRFLPKVRRIVETTEDPLLLAQFQEIIDLLSASG